MLALSPHHGSVCGLAQNWHAAAGRYFGTASRRAVLGLECFLLARACDGGRFGTLSGQHQSVLYYRHASPGRQVTQDSPASGGGRAGLLFSARTHLQPLTHAPLLSSGWCSCLYTRGNVHVESLERPAQTQTLMLHPHPEVPLPRDGRSGPQSARRWSHRGCQNSASPWKGRH